MSLKTPLVLLGLLLFSATAAASQAPRQAQRLLDQNRPEQALQLLDEHLARNKKDAAALLLRSSAHFMGGDRANGRADLERALKIDGTLRQGWLNLGAVELSESRYPAAIQAFERAADLDPTATDNELNLGTAHILSGDVEKAHSYFGTYLQRTPTADAYYLVATNFYLAGMEDFAVEHLERAIRLDEKTRLRIRGDATFRPLEQNPRLAKALTTDLYRPPRDAAFLNQAYSAPYESTQGTVLKAVVDSLTELEIPFSPRIEVNETWAIIWFGESPQMRLKISARDSRSSLLEVVGPGRSSNRFREQLKPLLDQIGYRLLG
ncbi:MAG: tetratricopeptide repeat protein [Acidobacteriota bacterium]